MKLRPSCFARVLREAGKPLKKVLPGFLVIPSGVLGVDFVSKATGVVRATAKDRLQEAERRATKNSLCALFLEDPAPALAMGCDQESLLGRLALRRRAPPL